MPATDTRFRATQEVLVLVTRAIDGLAPVVKPNGVNAIGVLINPHTCMRSLSLKESGLAMGVHRVARLMSENGLKARQKTRFKRTTGSDHGGLVAKNVLDQNFTADAPDQKWGVDISYVWTAEGWLYLAIVLDLYSRKIVG